MALGSASDVHRGLCPPGGTMCCAAGRAVGSVPVWGEHAGCGRAPKSNGECLCRRSLTGGAETKEKRIRLMGRSPLVGAEPL